MPTKKSSNDLESIGSFQETSTVELLHPSTDEPLYDDDGKPFSVTVFGPTSPQYKKLVHDQTNRRIQKAQRSQKVTMTAEQLESQQMELYSKAVKSWHLFLKGEVPDCTPAKVREIFDAYPWIYEQVVSHIEDRRNFLA